jgi:signal transduction histidine kinase
MPYGWWRRAIERRLETLSAVALIVWVGGVAAASAITTGRITATLVAERTQIARHIATRVEHAMDVELSRLYREPSSADLPINEQLPHTLPALSSLLREFHDEPYRVTLVAADGQELAASDGPRTEGSGGVLAATAEVGRSNWTIRLAQPMSDALGPIFWLRRLLVWSAALSCVLAFLLAWGAAQSVRRPILRLTADAQRLAKGNIKEPIAPAGVDEIGQLADALEQMRKALAQDELLGRLLRKVIAAQEDERKRLARELHDETLQQLTALGIQLDLMDPSQKSIDARRLVRRMADDLHRVIYDLRPSILDDLGLLPAILWCAERLTARGIAVQFEFPETWIDLGPEARITVYRVVQEALMNIERHARAETVLIACTLTDALLSIEVEDDGIGFDPAEMQQPRENGQGLGLLGMRERLALLGGTCTVDSQRGQGTRVVIRVPRPSSQPIEIGLGAGVA